jgi:hypothetical protein
MQAVIPGGWSMGGLTGGVSRCVNGASRFLFHALDAVQSICLGYVRKCAVVRLG